MSASSSPSPQIHDLFVVGAGPHALGCVTRLFEHTPNALYTDVEHSRLHWLRKHVRSGTMKKRAVPLDIVEQGKSMPKPASKSVDIQAVEERPSVAVYDKHKADWLGTCTLQKSFEIKNLRSPLFFHPHPGDIDALKSYAYAQGRQSELIEVGGVVGNEWSKHQKKAARIKGKTPRGVHVNMRSQDDYHTPSTPLFSSFINDELISHYSLDSVVNKGTVSSITYSGKPTLPDPNLDLPPTPPASPTPSDDTNEEPLFTITTDDGKTIQSRAVVMAVGPGAIPNVPDELGCWEEGVINGEGWCHTASFLKDEFVFPPPEVLAGKKEATCLVIGGGLTSAQIADLALRKGFTKVVLLCRSHLTVKPFDIGTEWMGKFSNLYKMIYFQEDDYSARMKMYKDAREGGSINVPYHKRLKALITAGKVDMRTQTSVRSLDMDQDRRWTIEIVKMASKTSDEEFETLSGIDYIVAATGSKFSIDNLPFLQSLHKSHPIKTMGGFPILTDDLQWRQDIPFFVMGGYAGLQYMFLYSYYPFVVLTHCGTVLGPGAPNLIGSREGAERIANGLSAHFPQTWGEDAPWRNSVGEEGAELPNWRKTRGIGNTNMFAGLEEEID